MSLRIYNTLTGKVEEFVPINPPNVLIYTCGVTVYDDSHVGHGRSLIVFDVFRRFLEHMGYRVKFVRNFTDVDDKIINKAKEECADFKDTKGYRERLKQAQESTGLSEAMLVAEGLLKDERIVLSVMDFGFIGGSMGSVVGERFYRACMHAKEKELPLVAVITSGGARMQEGILSLMQMAKTSIGVGYLKERGLPYITVLTDPTTGGVSASFAFLGDIIIAEPKALIGFAGPRVIEQTIKQQLPEGFQTSEFLLEKGMVDMVVHRKDLKDTLYNLIKMATYWRRHVAL